MTTATTETTGTTVPAKGARANPPLATAEVVLDADLLCAAVGRPVRATRLRHKPGQSTTAALVGTDPEHRDTPLGWVRVVTRDQRVKVDNAVRYAAERGRSIAVHDLGANLVLAWGPVDTDPRLRRGLDALAPAVPDLADAMATGRVSVLRYNPYRRLVLRLEGQPAGDHPLVVRVVAAPTSWPRPLLAHLRDLGLPLATPAEHPLIPTGPRTSVWEWVPGRPLATLDRAQAGRTARSLGEALGVLHSADPGAALVPRGSGNRMDRVHAVARQVGELAPRLAQRAARLVSALPLPAVPQVVVHGDLSADQVVVAGNGWHLLDLDRCGLGHPSVDLGSFAAWEAVRGGRRDPGADLTGDLTGELLAGYRVTAPPWADAGSPGQLPAGTAAALMLRASEPFRDGHLDWEGQVERRLDQVEEVLTR